MRFYVRPLRTPKRLAQCRFVTVVSLVTLGFCLAGTGCAERKAMKTIDSIISPGSARLKLIQRFDTAAVVFDEIMSSRDKTVPANILARAQCVVLMPGLQSVSFVVGAQWGSGFVVCRKPNGKGWSAPGAVTLKGGSFGLQIGGQQTNLMLLVMNRGAEDRLLSNQITLGVDASAAAGPVGRSVGAQTNLEMQAEILSWSQSSGLFAGVSLQGAALREDADTLRLIYGQPVTNRQVITGNVKPPESARLLLRVLNRYSPRLGA
jgi:lipid-binding SYLF domain-containing protein